MQPTNTSNNSSSDIVTSNHLLINNPVHPIIKLPFPPKIDPLDLIPVKPSSPQATQTNFKPTRSPNAFIIYRKAFVKAAREEGQCLPMTVISSMASSSWEHEPDEVKAEYKRIAKAAYLKRKELYPKERKRRRKERWNIVSFNAPTNNNTINDNNDTTINDNNNTTINDNHNTVNDNNNTINDNNNNNAINDDNDIIISDNTLISPPLLSSTSSSVFSSPIAPNSSESLEYSPQIDSNSNDSSYVDANSFINTSYGSNSYDPLLLTPEFPEPSNFENINVNSFNQPDIINLSEWFGYDEQIQKQTAIKLLDRPSSSSSTSN